MESFTISKFTRWQQAETRIKAGNRESLLYHETTGFDERWIANKLALIICSFSYRSLIFKSRWQPTIPPAHAKCAATFQARLRRSK
ncbi:hypothetical protein GQ600_13834 [Phytophthora cactorum]|nr:hypothetical protein GQ600_13834 [Phytophthora cactorum]